jgi:hypothetical protein
MQTSLLRRRFDFILADSDTVTGTVEAVDYDTGGRLRLVVLTDDGELLTFLPGPHSRIKEIGPAVPGILPCRYGEPVTPCPVHEAPQPAAKTCICGSPGLYGAAVCTPGGCCVGRMVDGAFVPYEENGSAPADKPPYAGLTWEGMSTAGVVNATNSRGERVEVGMWGLGALNMWGLLQDVPIYTGKWLPSRADAESAARRVFLDNGGTIPAESPASKGNQ